MKVLVISGFLGAGKTTFIKQMVETTKREYVIFENEFADINIDGDILKNELDNKSVEVWEMSNGCVCCSTKADFSASLIVIENSLKPDFLIVEPSGVAILSNVISNIQAVEYDQIKLLNPITIVDCSTYFKYKNKYNDVFIDQITSTTNIQLSKTEFVDKNEIELICKDIQTLNPKVQIFKEDYHNEDINYWNNLFDGELVKKEKEDIVISNQKLQNMSYTNSKCSSIESLIYFIDKIILGYYGNICRAKGIFQYSNFYIRFDLVDSNYELSFIEKKETNDVIFIGNDLKKDLLKNELEKL